MGESLDSHFDLRFSLDIYNQKSNLLARTYFFVFYIQKTHRTRCPTVPSRLWGIFLVCRIR